MSESRKVRFASDNEVKPLIPKITPIPKLKLTPKTMTTGNHGVINPLEDLVQCTLCLDKMKEPKMLTCQHTFCLNCLQYNLPSGAINVKCSICNEITNLQYGFESLEHLPGNMYINSILKVLTDGGISPHIPNTSTNTNTNINTNKNLQETLCIKCQTVCQFLEHTCQHCKQTFCVNCWPIHLTEITQNIKSLIDQLSDYDNRLDHQNDIFQDRCAKIENNIRETTEMKIQALRQQEVNCLKEVAEIKMNGLKSSEELKMRLKELQKNINDEFCNDKSDDTLKVLHFVAFHEDAAEIFEKISRWDDYRIVFDATNYTIDCASDAEAEAEAEAEIDEEVNEEEISQYKSSIMNPLDNPDNLIEHYKSRRFAPKLTWTKCSRPANVAVSPWSSNSIYIAGTDSRNIYIIDKQKGKLLSRIFDPSMLCPVGLTFSADELFVTDKWKHCIHVFAKQGTFLRSIGKKGNAPGQFRSPEGIAYHSNRLFVCDTGNDRVQVLNASSGSFLYSFGITGAGKAVTGAGFIMDFKYTELNMATGIAIADNRVIIADSGNRRIKIYTLEGTKTMEFGSLGRVKGQFRSPEIVAVDPLGFIFVGDSGNARVQVFRPNGTLVRVFGSKGKLAWVSGLCVTPQLDVIVSDYKSHTVHVF